ncbi:MAG: phytoene desaturase family protein [Anaerolineales bacterium]|nr:phytoene desaturase family protein [Anaerolineales bacterium]MDW8162647.1 phytoene desaturase family protein [Anaerolineales bacterium]
MSTFGRPVYVLGGGVGGLAAAIYLANAGRSVILLEQNEQVGGKMGEHRAAGFRWDTGPSVITMRSVLEELFTSAGKAPQDYLLLEAVDPLTRYFFWDGKQLDICRDLTRTLEQIAALDVRDVEGYLAFLAEAARTYRVVSPVFIFGPPPGLSSLRKVTLQDALSVDLLGTLQKRIERAVRHPHLRQLLGRFATYVGASPYLAPATLSSIAYVELAQGVWYPRGGVYRIAQACRRLASELGVEIRCRARVNHLRVREGRIVALELENGEMIPAETVISNIDVTTTYSLISAASAQKLFRRLKRLAPSCSGFILLLGVEGTHPELAHHNVFFSRDYRKEFDQIFRQGKLPEDPTMYVAITSKSDPDHAPPGCENWFVLVNSPPLVEASEQETVERASAYAEHILKCFAERGFDVRPKLRYLKILTPQDLQRTSGAWRGALYGPSFNSRFAPFARPGNRSPLGGLFFAGGSVHPGGGIPLAILSGKRAAELVLDSGKNQ